MGFLSWLRGSAPPKTGRGIGELAQRLKMTEAQLSGIPIAYQQFQIPKRRKGARKILAPVQELKRVQRQILRRVLGGLKTHVCATGFCRGHSIVSNALPHVGKAVLLRMDLKDFFPSTTAKRVKEFFEAIGWSTAAAELLTRLCTYQGALPQGAPTSPKLSNLLNQRLDARLARLAEALNASYTRYADDITYSLENDTAGAVRHLVHFTALVAREEGYQVHQRQKLYVRRRKDRQVVTGLVVNERINLPREIRRWLRAVEHHQSTGKKSSISTEQLAGWRSLQSMIQWQSGSGQEGTQEKPA
ncbi:MAG TPA: reverse transcriptase family protein [Tepidisphaeraceae bacterium]|nr:reverse transcriptase family protein [Tepidisphaeraceae bacterium]